MELIRTKYIDKLLKWKDKNVIKIITGVRRCGKSTILKQFKNTLLKDKNIAKDQIIEFKFSDDELSKLNETDLYKKIIKKAQKDKINYLFLDEIQEVSNFERAVISLFENEDYKFDIYLTGSNSKMFSEELSTLFTGRNIEIKCHPFCFSEYLKFISESKLIKETNKFEYFENYFIYGGLPIIFEVFDDKSLIQERLTQVLSDTIKKDIKRRHNIRKIDELYRLCQFTISNIGHTFSTRNIVNYLKSNEKSKISHMTIEAYLLWMCESLLIHPVSFYNTSGKRVLKTSKKYYSVDHGLKNALEDFKIADRGFLLENIVYNELIVRNYKVNAGKMRYGEIDFVATKGSEIIYIQVANTLNTEKIKKREYGNLMAIKDSYKKIVITEDRVNFTNDKGILTINVIDWLLDNK